MKRWTLFLLFFFLSICSCTDQKKQYIEKVTPVLNNLEQIGSEMERTVEAIRSDGISIIEFETKISDIEKRLNSEKDAFNQLTAPMELDQFQKNIREAIAGEQLAISSIRSYATRKNMLMLAEKQIQDLEKEEGELTKKKIDETIKTRLSKISLEKSNLKKQIENLKSEMDSQMKFYSNSHEYFVKMLKAMKKGLMGRSK